MSNSEPLVITCVEQVLEMQKRMMEGHQYTQEELRAVVNWLRAGRMTSAPKSAKARTGAGAKPKDLASILGALEI